MDVPDMPNSRSARLRCCLWSVTVSNFARWWASRRGRFHVVRDDATGRERVFANDGSPVVRTSDLGHADAAMEGRAANGGQTMAVDDFRAEILNEVAALTR